MLIDENHNAYGVQFRYRKNYIMKAFARKECILSAGPIKSPQVLMLSGIGPKNILTKLKIPVKSDLAVGRNLYDHLMNFAWYRIKAIELPSTFLLDITYQFAMHDTGPLTSLGLTRIFTMVNTENGTGQADFFLAALYFPKNSPDLRPFLELSEYRPEIRDAILNENKYYDVLAPAGVQLRPKSVGYITLFSSNPYDKPIIYPKYFDHPDDMDGVLRAIKKLYSLFKTKAFRALDAEMIRIPLEKCDRYKFQSDDYTRCYIHHFSTTVWHPVGTSKMGPDSDAEAVVDSRLKVRKIKRLRQIDSGM